MSERTERINELHDRAMYLAGSADVHRRFGFHIVAKDYAGRAAAMEQEAAERATCEEEPTRSVLHRSAATLHIDAGMPLVALEVAARGLRGTKVPEEIAAELIGVAERALEMVKKERGLV